MSDVPPRLIRRPLFLMLQVMREAGRLRDLDYPGERLRFAHHGVLACLGDDGPLSHKDVSQRLRIDPSDLVKVVDLLEEEGLVTRRRDPADRRRQILALTPRGGEVLEARERMLDRASEDLLAPLDPDERVQFEDMLRRLREGLLTRIAAHRP